MITVGNEYPSTIPVIEFFFMTLTAVVSLPLDGLAETHCRLCPHVVVPHLKDAAVSRSAALYLSMSSSAVGV